MLVILLWREHEQDAEDRDRVEQNAGDGAADDRDRHVPMRIHHLLGRAVLELEADVVEEEVRDEAEEHGRGGRQVAGRDAVCAVLRRIDDRRDREEAEHEYPREAARGRDPFPLLQSRDRDPDREPDEEQLEDIVAHRAEADVGQHARAPGISGDERERAADPERVRHPVEDRGDARVEAAEGHLRPLVGTTLLRERAADLGHHERVGQHEGKRQHDEPGESLSAGAGDQAKRVEPDEGADREEEHVEAPQRLLQLRLLRESQGRRVLDQMRVCRYRHVASLPFAPDPPALVPQS